MSRTLLILLLVIIPLNAWSSTPNFNPQISEGSSIPLEKSGSISHSWNTETPINKLLLTFETLFPEFITSRNEQCAISKPPTPGEDKTEVEVYHPRHQTPIIRLIVKESPIPNAYAFPAHDGKASMIISTALLETTNDEAELAFILAHEVAHILHDHTPFPEEAHFITKKHRKRIHAVRNAWENDADQFAIALLKDKNIDLEGSVRILEKLAQKQMLSFLDTNHLEHVDRIDRIKKALPF